MFIKAFFEPFADDCYFVFCEVVIERKCDCSFADGLSYGEITLFAIQFSCNKWLQMHRRKIITNLDAFSRT